MKETLAGESPPKEEGRTVNAANLANTKQEVSLSGRTFLVNGTSPRHDGTSLRARWRAEGRRLLDEYRRTRKHSHLKAFHVHRAAMGARSRCLGGCP